MSVDGPVAASALAVLEAARERGIAGDAVGCVKGLLVAVAELPELLACGVGAELAKEMRSLAATLAPAAAKWLYKSCTVALPEVAGVAELWHDCGIYLHAHGDVIGAMDCFEIAVRLDPVGLSGSNSLEIFRVRSYEPPSLPSVLLHPFQR
jgi:hypothetical protein